MNQLNSLIVEGNLVRDAELSHPTETMSVCNFSIAVHRWYKNRNGEGVDEASFFDVKAFGKCGEYCQAKAKKGRAVRVVGRLKQDVWKDENEKTHSKVFIIAEHIEFKPVYNKASAGDEIPSEEEVSDEIQVELVEDEIPVGAVAEAVAF